MEKTAVAQAEGSWAPGAPAAPTRARARAIVLKTWGLSSSKPWWLCCPPHAALSAVFPPGASRALPDASVHLLLGVAAADSRGAGLSRGLGACHRGTGRAGDKATGGCDLSCRPAPACTPALAHPLDTHWGSRRPRAAFRTRGCGCELSVSPVRQVWAGHRLQRWPAVSLTAQGNFFHPSWPLFYVKPQT